MVKKILKSNRWFLAVIILLSLFLVIFYFQMKNAERIIDEYRVSKACLAASDCTKTVPAIIRGINISRFSFVSYGSKGLPIGGGTFLKYVFDISIVGSKNQAIDVLPDTPNSLDGFDVENLYIPQKSNKSFVQDNFYNGKPVFVEIWRGKIIFLIVDSIIDNPDFIINSTPESQTPTSIGPAEPRAYNIFIPTVNHPLIGLESARSNFYGWGVVLVGVVSVMLMGISFDIEKVITTRKRKHDKPN